jgi:hypothetical protein
MSTSTRAARRLLRAADPIKSGAERAPQWPNPAARETLRAVMAHTAPTAERPRRRTLATRWLVPAAAAAVVVAVSITIAVVGGGRPDSAPNTAGPGLPVIMPAPQGPSGSRPTLSQGDSTGPTQPQTSQPPTGSAAPTLSNREVTQRAVSSLLADAPVLPGAATVDHAPVAGLKDPLQAPVADNLVQQTRWWTAPGTVDAALQYLKSQGGATGLSVHGGGSLGSSSGEDVEILVLVRGDPAAGDGASSDAYSQLALVLGVTRSATGVAVRVDAQAVVRPARSEAEHIPDGVTSVDIVVTRPPESPVHRVLTGEKVHDLAQVVDELATLPPLATSCPAAARSVQLTFTGADVDIVVEAGPGACGAVTVRSGGEFQPTLAGGPQVYAAVMAALGLSSANDGAIETPSRAPSVSGS